MGKLVELPDGRVIEFPDSMTDAQVDANLRLSLAGEQGTNQATARWKASGDLSPADTMRMRNEASKTPNVERERELNMATRLREPGAAGTALAAVGTLPVIANPMSLLTGIGGGWLGDEAGGKVGRWAEGIGAPQGTEKVLRAVGGFGGGVYGGLKGESVIAGLRKAGVGKGGILGAIFDRVAPAAETAIAPEAAAATAKTAARVLAPEEAAVLQARAADITQKTALAAERHELQKKILQARLDGTLPPRSVRPKVAQAPISATPEPVNPAATAPKADILPDGQRSMATNLGGKAKAGPAPTKPEDLEETLRKSLDALPAAKSPLQAPRIQIGAERVGRPLGMTKEAVRAQAGPVLDEAVGEASPILPHEPLKKIIDTMRAIPRAEREAYVARATSGKTKWQVENIRRTLEHLGLLVPLGAAGAAAGRE